jgi:hypothetical protein
MVMAAAAACCKQANKLSSGQQAATSKHHASKLPTRHTTRPREIGGVGTPSTCLAAGQRLQ